jgi:uncharacterized protein
MSTEEFRPVPLPTDWDLGYWQAAGEGRLVVQRCRACDTVRGLPRPICPKCASFAFEWVPTNGAGTIYSFTILRRQFHKLFSDLPLVTCLVALEEYPRIHLVTDLGPDIDPARVAIGNPVTVEFVRHGGIVLPRFRLVDPVGPADAER